MSARHPWRWAAFITYATPGAGYSGIFSHAATKEQAHADARAWHRGRCDAGRMWFYLNPYCELYVWHESQPNPMVYHHAREPR